jgi:oxalate decarboxylase/phosphoglucose isomerase-like protein (cupin superfamily)
MVQETQQVTARSRLPYDRWMEAQGLPVYRGHFVAEPRVVELAPWPERGVNAAFIQLDGMAGVCEARITEIPPGETSEPVKMALSELVYVLDGQGLTTVWAGDGPKQTFEWQKSSLFCLPRHCWHTFSNTRGDRPARLLNYNHLPVAMSVVQDPKQLLNNAYEDPDRLYGKTGSEFYAEAKAVDIPGARRGHQVIWRANFFPDMGAWDKLLNYPGRGAGGKRLGIQFPGAEMDCHMSVFDPQLYKKGHRHGPGRVIVIPKGEGYSALWPGDPMPKPLEGGEHVICPWSEGSIFVPPENWYHQHFNTGDTDARYLALGALPQFGGNPYRHQLEYPDEAPWTRETFERELAKKGLKSLMPDECYEDRDFEWDYGDDD